ncbi:MAG: 6-pyruvoyl-tetrahydropterin synthase-related protein [Caldilineaceae bacterium]
MANNTALGAQNQSRGGYRPDQFCTRIWRIYADFLAISTLKSAFISVNPRTISDSATPSDKQPSLADAHRPRLWRDGFFWLALAFSIFAVAPFLQPGYFWGANDARHHIYFLFEFNRLWQDGVWWPRWSPDFTFGYGYPFFNIYGPFSHFVAELLLYYGKLSYTGAIKTVFGLSILGSAAAMYAYVRTWAGRQAALCAALVYVYAPYHLLNLYVRANLAESMAFVWLPLALWAVRQCVLQPSYGAIAGLGISVAGLLLTSQLVTLLFLPLLGVYFLVLLVQYGAPDGTQDLMLPVWVRFGAWLRRALAPALGMAAAVGLSCIFWLPMVLEYGDVRVDQWYDGRYDFRGNFVYFFQLFSPQWGFGISRQGPNDTIGFQLGVVPLILAAVALLLLWPRRPKVRGSWPALGWPAPSPRRWRCKWLRRCGTFR